MCAFRLARVWPIYIVRILSIVILRVTTFCWIVSAMLRSVRSYKDLFYDSITDKSFTNSGFRFLRQAHRIQEQASYHGWNTLLDGT